MKAFVQCIQQDQKFWNMIIDMPHGNKAYLTRLKNVEFVVEAFTSRTNAEHINIGTFAPQDSTHSSVVNMKDNIEKTHLETELGIADDAKTKVDTRCHYNLKIMTWEQLKCTIANLNCFVLFIANHGNAAKKRSLTGTPAAKTKPYLSCQLEMLMTILSAPGMNHWQEEVSKQYRHLYFTILMRVQNALATWVAVCHDHENNENAGTNVAPGRMSIFVEEFDAAMSMLMSDLQMAKHSQTAGNFAMAPLTFTKFCPAPIKIEKTFEKQSPSYQAPGSRSNNSSGDKRGRVTFNDDSARRDSPSSFKKAKSDEQVEFSKSKGMFKLVPGKTVNARLHKPPLIEFEGKRAPLCLKHCSAGMACQFKNCKFHHLSLAAAQNLKSSDKSALDEYARSEPAITWFGESSPFSAASGTADTNNSATGSVSETQPAAEGNTE